MFSLGQLLLKSNLFLSPLAGYTNLPFRLVIREIGGVDLCTTDLVNARSLIEQNPKALKLIETNKQDNPLSVQLFGGVKEEMRDAAVMLVEKGIDSIDVNMGCPVPKVTKTGGGASMMTELPKTQELIRTMVEAVRRTDYRKDAIRLGRSKPHRSKPCPCLGRCRAWLPYLYMVEPAPRDLMEL